MVQNESDNLNSNEILITGIVGLVKALLELSDSKETFISSILFESAKIQQDSTTATRVTDR